MEHSTTIIIHDRDLDKIFDLAKEYFPRQGFKWVSENKPVMAVFKRGSVFGATTKGIKATLTVSFKNENLKTTINAHYNLGFGAMSEGSRKIFNEEIDGFKVFVEDSIPVEKSPSTPSPEPELKQSAMTCPKCKKGISSEFTLCPYCGETLKFDCKKCGKQVSPEFVICPFCGEKL